MSIHQNDKISEVLKLTSIMAKEDNRSTLLRKGLELCATILDCERGLLLSATDNKHATILEQTGTEQSQSFSTSALQMVMDKREPLLISDTIEDLFLGSQESINRNDIRSILCSILETGNEAFQNSTVYLYLDSSTNRHPFSFADLERFRLLCSIMSGLLAKSDQIASQGATIEALKSEIEEKRFSDLIFSSDSFNQCLRLISQSAPTGVPVLLIGETGTGKERLARIVHDLSNRKEKTFLAVNCGAIPSNLIESQLFGHEKGAFTGAVSSRKGHFEEASGGTLFLDEIGELPLQVQSQFLRVLQEGELLRVGSSKPIKVDVRIVAATNVNLEKAVQDGKFRQDLYYRLNVIQVQIPPVRERSEDALLLVRFFLNKFCTTFGSRQLSFTRESEKAILSYDWPGNVREIQNKVQRAVITASSSTINPLELGLKDTTPTHANLRDAREAVDRELIAYAMAKSPGNLTNAAKILDIDRKSLRILLEKYGISTSDIS